MPKDGDAVDFTIPNRAENAPGPEGLSPADFLKHCLSIHNRTGHQVHITISFSCFAWVAAAVKEMEAGHNSAELLMKSGSSDNLQPAFSLLCT